MTCDAPLFRERTNRWVLARTDRDNVGEADVRRTARAVMSTFFSRNKADVLTSRSGDAADIVVGTPTHDFKPTGKVVKLRQQCEGELATVSGRKPWFVPVEFTWRGGEASKEWPIHKAGLWFDRPKNADWLLFAVLEPGAQAKPEDVTPLLDDNTLEEAKTTIHLVVAGAVLIAGAVLLTALRR